MIGRLLKSMVLVDWILVRCLLVSIVHPNLSNKACLNFETRENNKRPTPND